MIRGELAPIFLIACVYCTVVVPNVDGGPDTKPLPVKDAIGARAFGQLMPIGFSPDGNWLAYTVKGSQKCPEDLERLPRTGVPKWVRGDDIYISNITTGESKSLTEGSCDNWLPTWSPDGHSLAFLSDRNGTGAVRLWIWDVLKNDARRVSDVEALTEELEWTLDGHHIVLTSLPHGLPIENAAPGSPSAVGVQLPAVSKASDSTVNLYYTGPSLSADNNAPTSDPWNLDRSLRDLISIDIRSGKATSIVRGKRIATYLLSPDGKYIAYTIPKRFEKAGSQQILFDLVTITMATNEQRVVASDIRLDYDGASFSWSPDSLRLGFHVGGVDERTYDCYIADVKNGLPRNVSMLPPMSMASRHKTAEPLWDANGEHIYFIREGALWRASQNQGGAEEIVRIPEREIVQMIPKSGNLLWTPDRGKSTIVVTHDNIEKQDGFYRIDFDRGRSSKLLEKNQCYTCVNTGKQFTVTKDGERVAFFIEDAEHNTDLWISAPAFERPQRLTHLNPQFDKYKLGSARLINWLSDDGERLQGALLLPSDYRKTDRYPLIVWVYGGAALADNVNHFGLGYGGPFNLQLLATRGYAVFLPDTPLHVGTPMLDLAKAVLPGVNKVIEMGIADPERLGVMGHSFGGYCALALLVETKRFKTAIEINGFGDLPGNYGTMDKSGAAFGTSNLEHGQGSMGGIPWQYRERYIENSPFFYLDRVETPLLIVVGANDTTVAPFLGDEVFVGLRRLGKVVVEYAKYSGEGHSPLYWSNSNQVDFCNRMIAWLDMHLRK